MGKAFARSSLLMPRYARAFSQIERYCMFVGYPRSGHTLVGSLLSAHPECVISHELDVLWYLQRGLSRSQLFTLILDRDRRFKDEGHRWTGFNYSVEGLWQGQFQRLRVIGDKKGGASSLSLERNPELLSRLRKTVRVPIRVIHVVRDPYDNISTMVRRGYPNIDSAIPSYFRRCETIHGLVCTGRLRDDEYFEMHLDDLTADPKYQLRVLCGFLGLDAPDDFLSAAADRVFSAPRRSRTDVPWSPREEAEVAARARRYPFLTRYAFDS